MNQRGTSLMNNVKAILFDLDGVFYEAEQAITGAADVVDWTKENNIPHLFLTNTTSRPRSSLLDKLKSFGISTDLDHILTPPVATVGFLENQSLSGKVALFVPELTQHEFESLPISQEITDVISAVVIGDLGENWTYTKLNTAFRFLMNSPPPLFISLGMTRYWKANDGLRLDVAPFVSALETASGIKPMVMGKPARAFFQTALEILQVKASETIMIGDDIRGDVEGAQKAGIQGVLVKTGKFQPDDLNLDINPDAILESVCELPEYWHKIHI